jgi:D-3-phosphoglycerate dehydrogenase
VLSPALNTVFFLFTNPEATRIVSSKIGLVNVTSILLRFCPPHIGGSTEEARENIAYFVSNKLLDYLLTGSTFTSVNFPKIHVPKTDDSLSHRLLHVHQNVPGVLSEINGIFAKNNVNVLSQYLRTNELIGYVIANVDREYKVSLLDDLRGVRHAIRVRIL